MKKICVNIAGWGGMILIILAFSLVSFEKIVPTDMSYQLMNLFGAFGIVVTALSKRDYPPAVLNVVFGLIALVALVRIFI